MRSTCALLVLLAAIGLPHSVLAQEATCSLGSAKLIPEVEVLNKLVLAADYDGLYAALHGRLPTLTKSVLASLKAATPGPFTSCSTLIQREDNGSFVQAVVMFHRDDFIVWSYWALGSFDGEFGILRFSLDTDIVDSLGNLH